VISADSRASVSGEEQSDARGAVLAEMDASEGGVFHLVSSSTSPNGGIPVTEQKERSGALPYLTTLAFSSLGHPNCAFIFPGMLRYTIPPGAKP
jgi:hypothetical protein